MNTALDILVAEDNPVNARLAEALLTSQGCRVTLVGNGADALGALAANRYDLVFMDMRMPVMDGLEATRQYRAAGGKVPIVALTANAFDEDRDACLAAGMDGFLPKPIALADLQALLTRVANPAPQVRAG